MENLSLAYSTCPNDTFMFGAIAEKHITTKNFNFDIQMSDIEELNNMALEGIKDITKISCALYPQIEDKYIMLTSGAALGHKNGPILISNNQGDLLRLGELKVGIPGKLTTANLLLSTLASEITDKVPMLFSDIEGAIENKDIDAGLIIHENRFTYKERGFVELIDLGSVWEKKHSMPIPLGCIVVKRELAKKFGDKINALIKSSILFAYMNRKKIAPYIAKNAQTISEDVINSHIKLYVNNYSVDLGAKGKKAIEQFFRQTAKSGSTSKLKNKIFV